MGILPSDRVKILHMLRELGCRDTGMRKIVARYYHQNPKLSNEYFSSI